jgi:S-adenosylmethionine:tRNA-ribosyltransferase-isomerase (queuine synthetase)
MFFLSHAERSSDVEIMLNAPHLASKPEKALAEIRKALKENDVLTLDTTNRTAVQMRAKTGRKGQRSRMRARTSRSRT